MELTDVRALATDLMRRHGVSDWRLEWDNARTRAGMCRYHARTISLSMSAYK